MPDRETVIKELHDTRQYLEDKEWSDRCASPHIDAINDALALLKEQEDLGTELTNAVELIHKKNERIEKLLKEQEAVEPYVTGRGETFETAETWWYACGNCHEALDVNDKYCRHCGRTVKWE